MTPTTNPTPQDKGGESQDHEVIWLQPACCADTTYERTGRQWCEDNVFECDDGAEATKYVRADLHSTLTEETARLKERVRVLEERLEPFARMASDIHEAAPDSALCVVATLNGGIMSNKNFCTVGDLRRARSALHTTPEVVE